MSLLPFQAYLLPAPVSLMPGLYIHIPFCRSRCHYCAFYSTVSGNDVMDRYVDALAVEIEARRHLYTPRFDTVYIGGGTPSALPPAALTRLLALATAHASPGAELTFEANPDDMTPRLASILADGGVNRVSMGVQSMVDSELAAIGRRHDAAAVTAAVASLRRAGIDNISLDLIYGLPGQTDTSLIHSLSRIIALDPDHVSAYLLSFEPSTRLYRDLEQGKVRQISDTGAEQFYTIVCRELEDAGYSHYEISNFCRPGRESRHNSSYWDPTVPYLGLGAAAHSYDGISHRRANVASLPLYLANPADAADPELTETLTPLQIFDERVMLGLRTSLGVDLASLDPRLAAPMLRRARKWISSGSLILSDNRLHIHPRSWLIADAITSDLFAD